MFYLFLYTVLINNMMMDGLRLYVSFFQIFGFSDIDEVKNKNAHSSLSCAWHSCLEPKETLKAGQKVMTLGSKIAFILNLCCFINHEILNLGRGQYLIINVEYYN